jgi:hypothetical protein
VGRHPVAELRRLAPPVHLKLASRRRQSPTMFDIVRLFRNVERYEVAVGDDRNIFPAQLTKLQKQVLELLEVSLTAYQ